MEHFLVGLLNKIYDYNLVNLNVEETNFTSIDLGDYEKRIAIQVTSDNTSTKIKETLKKFFENNYDYKFDTLIILIVGNKKNYTANFTTNNNFCFSPEQHVWDFKKIFKDIGNKDTEDIEKIALYLNQELSPCNGYAGSGLFSIATDMKNKTYALCVSKLLTTGITKESAESIISEDLKTAKYNYILDEARQGTHYLVGGFGSGKSHAVLILCQQLLDMYASGKIDAIPLYIHARDLRTVGSISTWIENISIQETKHILFIDGLDEVDYTLASNLIEEERYLSSLNSDNLIIVCSRPMTYLPDKSLQLQIRHLSESEQKQLISKVSSKAASYFSPHTLEQEMSACVELPLFCIIYALLKGSDNLRFAKNKIDLITVFIEKAVKKISETNKSVYDDLVNLSICATQANYGDIHISDVTLTESIDTILKTGLVEANSDYLSFPLAIVPQFLAAKALQYKKINLSDITLSIEKIYQWKYALSILFSQAPFEETFELFSSVFCKAPGLSAQIISDGTRSGYRNTLPSALECGKKLILCMNVWEKALGSLCKYLVPKNKNNEYNICVSVDEHSLVYSWYPTVSEKISVKPIEEMKYTPGTHWGPVPAQSNWPWIITFKMLTDHLTDCINNKSILGNGHQLAKEYLWHNALLLANKGSLCHSPIPVSNFDIYKSHRNGTVNVKGKYIHLPTFFSSMEASADEKTGTIIPPFPVGDQKYSTYVWSCYSRNRYLELTRYVFSSALKEYSDLMRSDFSCFASEMYTSQLMPCKIVGDLEFDPKMKYGPVMHWYLLALEKNQSNDIDINFGTNAHNSSEEIRFIYENHKKNRPNLRGDGFIICTEALHLNCPTPVTVIVYEWIRKELKRLGWINLF